jgi:eukaryotic-like serine/threonine-protein kinase
MREPTADIFGIVGSTLGGAYEVESVVAEGGFAVVYRARHRGFSAPVALKCLKLSQRLSPERQARFLAQFRSEAELMFQLSSRIPSVVRPLHVDALTTAQGSFVPFLVLEWLEGETLEAHVERRVSEGRGPPPLKKLVRLLTPVARALERAHNFPGPTGTVSIVHRDLKPENIFIADVGGEQVVKILDFGVARAESVASQVAGTTSDGGGPSFFTPPYAAPEQWLPKRFGQTGPWTDVWGMALTLVEAASGCAPFEGDIQAMMSRALDKHQRPTPRSRGVDVPDAIEQLFERALALDPRERPADIGLFWDELTLALGMKLDDRHRDLRSEAGLVPREERIEAVARQPHRSGAVPRLAAAHDAGADDSRSRLRAGARIDPDSSSEIAIARPIAAASPVARVELVKRAPPAAPMARQDPDSAPLELELQSSPPPTNEQRLRPVAARERAAPAHPAIWPRLGLGTSLIVAAIALALVDRALQPSGGIPLGPVSTTLVAAVLVLVGVGLIVHQLLPRDRG